MRFHLLRGPGTQSKKWVDNYRWQQSGNESEIRAKCETQCDPCPDVLTCDFHIMNEELVLNANSWIQNAEEGADTKRDNLSKNNTYMVYIRSHKHTYTHKD